MTLSIYLGVGGKGKKRFS